MAAGQKIVRNAGPASLTLVPGEEQPAWPVLRDLAFLLGAEAGGLAGRLAPTTASAVGDLVRGMNCYYSNLIEGHDTRPVDIERALRSDLEAEPKRRNLQLEAAAHIAVQAAIDGGELDDRAAPSELAVEIHRRFYELMPAELRFVEERGSGRLVEVLPGRLREGHVEVGDHVAPPPDELPGWLKRLDEGAPERFGRADRLVAIAALHHRLLWVHPFADGNGRTARLLSHALLRRAGVGSALWSVSRGLARHVDAYKTHLARADAPPQGALDGRGILSDGRLSDFCRFFLAACLDQVRFMAALLAPEALSSRVREFVAAEAAGGRLDPRVGPLLEAAVLFGRVPRGDVPGLVGTSDRQARRLAKPLVDRGLLTGTKDAPFRIAFPLGETERLFPHLWAPAGVASGLPPLPEVEEALRRP
ncbi:Fic family protein [Roseicella frigidaeris]|uniref:Fic family protein n=2 Tax=Roseicella frigidaeris TaxID=2230885 RepID=A0A327LT80_9PROT|nr:Fic family protein [Roseicella frigidaeris]